MATEAEELFEAFLPELMEQLIEEIEEALIEAAV